jgi:hypothetical protein
LGLCDKIFYGGVLDEAKDYLNLECGAEGGFFFYLDKGEVSNTPTLFVQDEENNQVASFYSHVFDWIYQVR